MKRESKYRVELLTWHKHLLIQKKDISVNQTLFAHSEAHFKTFSSVFLSHLERAAYSLPPTHQPTHSPSLFLILTMVMSGVSAAAGLLPRTYRNFIIIEEVDSDAIECTQRDGSCNQQCWVALVIMNINSAVNLRYRNHNR